MLGQHHLMHFLKNRELDELYACIAVRSFALSMVTIFVPIYLLQLNYSLKEVFLFYLTMSAVFIAFTPVAAKIAGNRGLKHSIFYSTPIMLAAFGMLYYLEIHKLSIYFIAALFGIASPMFWIAYHADFAKYSDRGKREQEVGFSQTIAILFQVAGPLLGGIILSTMGFDPLFAVTAFLFVLSVVPLFASPDTHEPFSFSIKNLFAKRKAKDIAGFFAHGIETNTAEVVWPVFIFFTILNDFTLTGLARTLTLLFSTVIVAGISLFPDNRKKVLLKIGAISNSIIWAVKTTASTALQVFSLDAIHGTSKTMVSVPLDAITYDRASRQNILEYVMSREISIQLGRMALFALLIMLPQSLATGFWLAAAASVLYLLF